MFVCILQYNQLELKIKTLRSKTAKTPRLQIIKNRNMEVNIAQIINFSYALNHEEFSAKMYEIQSQYSRDTPLFLLFTGEKVDGKSWCPDCTNSEPIIMTSLEEYQPNSVLVTFQVVRSEYKTQDYVYRTNPAIDLHCVPTLHRL